MRTLREIKKWLVCGSFLAISLLLLPGVSMAGIEGSGHDFTDADGGSGNTPADWAKGKNGDAEICIACHTPHNGSYGSNFGANLAPLWNTRQESSASYTLYTSVTDTLDGTQAAPVGMSKLCLSCHDGTIALENFGGVTSGTTKMNNNVVGGPNFGSDLSNDHPVNIIYSDWLIAEDGELHARSNPLPWDGTKTLEGELLFGDTANEKTVECASCHDVHNSADVKPLLRVSNAGSQLCLACHDK